VQQDEGSVVDGRETAAVTSMLGRCDPDGRRTRQPIGLIRFCMMPIDGSEAVKPSSDLTSNGEVTVTVRMNERPLSYRNSAI
jgi:hypothetical protein